MFVAAALAVLPAYTWSRPLTVTVAAVESDVSMQVRPRNARGPGGVAHRLRDVEPWSHSTPTTDSVKCGNPLGRLQSSEQEAAINAVMHDEKIHDRLDRIYKLRDGRLIETEERA